MPAVDLVIKVVRGWVEKAENDLKAAELIMKGGKEMPADTAALHAQQCAEKYLKAYLALEGIEFPKTHDIGALIIRATGLSTGLSPENCRMLTAYATITRYPDDYVPVSLSDARHALTLARRVRKAVRKELPRPALSRRMA
jgi:HEPN domain-containing protein